MTPRTCTTCGSADVISIQPGTERQSCGGILYARGTPDVAWCGKCWAKRFAGDLFSFAEAST